MRTLHFTTRHRPQLSRLFILLLFTAFLPGCGLLIGNVKPVSEKSESYRVMDLAKANPDWERIDEEVPAESTPSDEEEPIAIPDVAYQSRANASIISLNSGCRPRIQETEQTLKEFSDQLFLGIAKITSKEEKEITAAGLPALETTASGQMNSEAVKIRTVVLRDGRCIYDLSYISRPDQFAKDETLFSQFVASLRLR